MLSVLCIASRGPSHCQRQANAPKFGANLSLNGSQTIETAVHPGTPPHVDMPPVETALQTPAVLLLDLQSAARFFQTHTPGRGGAGAPACLPASCR